MVAGWRLVATGTTRVIRGVGSGLGTESPRANDLIQHAHVMEPPKTGSMTGFGEHLVGECTPVQEGGAPHTPWHGSPCVRIFQTPSSSCSCVFFITNQ